jgi:hypothetical protein
MLQSLGDSRTGNTAVRLGGKTVETNQEYSKEPPPPGLPSALATKVEPLLMSGSNPKFKNSPHADREFRAMALAEAWGGTVKEFVLAHHAEIIQVREDFLHKAKSKTICGCETWDTYVAQKLNCSPQHMRRLLAGDNPATAIHDGSSNRQPKWRASNTTATAILPDVVSLRKNVYSLVQRLDEAIKAIENSIELDPQTETACVEIAEALNDMSVEFRQRAEQLEGAMTGITAQGASVA